MAELIIVDDTEKVRRFPVRKDELIIGRCEDCDIQIDDAMISRYHAKVVVNYVIQDMDSTNGIWKRGKRVNKTAITPGEDLILGKSSKYQLRLEPGDNLATVPKPEPAQAAKPPEPPPVPEPVVEKPNKPPVEKPSENKPDQALLKDLKTKDAIIQEMKAKFEQLKDQCLTLEEGNTKLNDENRFLRTSLYPDEPVEEPEELKKLVIPELPTVDTVVIKEESEVIPKPPPADKAVIEKETVETPQSTAPNAASGPADDLFLRKLINVYIPNFDMSSTLTGSSVEDLLYLVETLQKWGRDIERVTTRVAQTYSGILTPMSTMLPEAEHNITSIVKDLLTRGGSEPKEELEEYLLRLRTWYVACLGCYRKAMEKWCPEFLEKLSPNAIQKKKKYNFMINMMGLVDFFYWRDYKDTMRNVNVPTVIEEYEEYAAQAALEIANKDQKDPLGKGKEI